MTPVPTHPVPFVREGGRGPVVVCLHSNSASSTQWRRLSERLEDRFTVVAPDLWSAGRSPVWNQARPITLADEVALLEPVFDRCRSGCHLVGHSYGGAVALMAALRYPDQVRSIAIYEPTLFWLVLAGDRPADVDGIVGAATDAAAAFAEGRLEDGTRRFVDFWSGAGAWDRIPVERRPGIIDATRFIAHWAHAAIREATPLAAFTDIRVPVLVMSGEASPLSGRAPADLLARTLSAVAPVTRTTFAGFGHMAPVTDPEPINAAIAAFLDRQSVVDAG